MRQSNSRAFGRASRHLPVLAALAAFALAAPCRAGAQTAPVRRLTVDDAVGLALEQNLGIRIERFDPQIQDLAVAQARTGWVPTLSSSLLTSSTNTPSTSVLSGGQTKITDGRFIGNFGLAQVLPTGANYSVAWNSARNTTTNTFSNYNPLLSSSATFTISQPLLRNYKIDNLRQQVALSQSDRVASDYQLQSTIAVTRRNVKNAYWDLAYAIENLKSQKESLDFAQRALADNEKRVQIGTMAPLDIVEAQSEVARNEESVIVAAALIDQAEDRLRALIYDPATPDFWNIHLEPTEAMEYAPVAIDVAAATRRALASRTDMQLAKNDLARNDISIRYFKNQTLPDISAQANFQSTAAGGTTLSPVVTPLVADTPLERAVLSQRGYGSVIGDVFSSAYPTWSVGVTLSYPIGKSNAEANLARARLQYTQAETQLRNVELQIATQVRDTGRQVTTNIKRIDTTRAARELAERRLDAETRKFEAGIQTTFFVFQAQRDLDTARTAEIRAIADYNKSLVDFEAVQESSLTGAPVGVTIVQ